MKRNKRLTGLILFSMGIGMLLVIFLPWWSFFIAAFFVVYGFWRLFLC